VKWFRRVFDLLSPAEQSDAAIADCLLELDHLLREAEAQGHHFLPSARLARKMLQAINWR
jgi:hypothetical protein